MIKGLLIVIIINGLGNDSFEKREEMTKCVQTLIESNVDLSDTLLEIEKISNDLEVKQRARKLYRNYLNPRSRIEPKLPRFDAYDGVVHEWWREMFKRHYNLHLEWQTETQPGSNPKKSWIRGSTEDKPLQDETLIVIQQWQEKGLTYNQIRNRLTKMSHNQKNKVFYQLDVNSE